MNGWIRVDELSRRVNEKSGESEWISSRMKKG